MTGVDLGALAARLAPIVVFLLGITVTAEIAQLTGVFDVLGHHVARWGRHRVWLLWLLFAGLAVTCTAFLSLDTTAVLLTPVGLSLATQTGASAYPFGLTTLWIANTGSLFLPVSNLTNLLALHHAELLGIGYHGYVRLALPPGLVAVTVSLLLIAVLHHRELRTTYVADPPPQPHDTVLLRIAMTTTLAVGPLFALGLSPAWVASAAAVVGIIALARRDPGRLRQVRVPWLMALGFVVAAVGMAWADAHGLGHWIAGLVGHGRTPGDLLRLAVGGALGANVVNNLPAYLAMEPVAVNAPTRLVALLIGVDTGPLVTPWASLATLLWLGRCRSAGLTVRPGRLALAGLACVALVLPLATLAVTVG